MQIPPIDSIAIDAPPYVEVLASRVRKARRNPRSAKSKRILAEARDYLLHRRIDVPQLRVWSPPRPELGRSMTHGILNHTRWGPPPPMPTMAQIDAYFHRTPGPEIETPKRRRKRRPKAKPVPPPPPPPPPEPDVCFMLYDPVRRRGVTGPDLVRLATLAQQDGFTGAVVFVAAGLHPLVLNRKHPAFDPRREIFDAGRFHVHHLINDKHVRKFLTHIPVPT